MHLLRCTALVPDEALDMLTAVLARHVPFGWEEESLPTGHSRVYIHADNPAYMESLAQNLRAVHGAQVCLETVAVVDWTQAWREYFTPVLCGSRFIVLPPWNSNAPEAAGRTAIIIEPRSAFGTGHHATTALCLTALADVLDAQIVRPTEQKGRFADIGTGSGVLAIACCHAGLTGVAVDIDPLALDNARENAVLNNVTFAIQHGSVESVGEAADVVLANILAAPLRDMAADISACVRPDGILIVSGILDVQAESVVAAYAACGMRCVRRLCEDSWVALLLQHA